MVGRIPVSRGGVALAVLLGSAALAGCGGSTPTTDASPSTTSTIVSGACLESSTNCTLGDLGPGGGIVFYVADSPQAWGRFLEAPTRTSWLDGAASVARAPWGNRACYTKLLSPAFSAGDGMANSAKIAGACGHDTAAYLATQFAPRVGDGQAIRGWYLPSRGELLDLLSAADRFPAGNFGTETLASSSSDLGGTARPVGFAPIMGYGRIQLLNLGTDYAFWPIRAFGPTTAATATSTVATSTTIPGISSSTSTSTSTTVSTAPPSTAFVPPPARPSPTPTPNGPTTVPARPPTTTTTTPHPVLGISGDPNFTVFHVPSVSHDFTIVNSGTGVLHTGTPSITLPADQTGRTNPFTLSGCANATLTPGQTCTMVVTAHVVGNYASKGTLQVTSNGGNPTVALTASIT